MKYETYIRRVLRTVHPDAQITEQALAAMDTYVCLVEQKLAFASAGLCRENGRKTVSTRDVQTAVRILCPGEIARQGASEGTKAVTRWNGDKTQESSGLVFPISRARDAIKTVWCHRVGGAAPVYLAAVLEYLAADILEISGNNARAFPNQRINDWCLKKSVENDEELEELFTKTGIQITHGGVRQRIHDVLLPQRGGRRRETIQKITKPALRRLMARGGVKRVQGLVWEQSRGLLTVFLDRLLGLAVTVTEHERRKTLMPRDVATGATHMGITIAGPTHGKRSRKPVCKRTVSAGGRDQYGIQPSVYRDVEGAEASDAPAIRLIRRMQTTMCPVFPRGPFKELVKETAAKFKDVRVSTEAAEMVQVLAEEYLVGTYRDAQLCAIHANRQTIEVRDLQLAVHVADFYGRGK